MKLSSQMYLQSKIGVFLLISLVFGHPGIFYQGQNQILNPNAVFEHSSQIPVAKPQFESPEHTSIGDKVLLKYPKFNKPGTNFNYKVKGSTLSFGDIIALAADFYYDWQIGDCKPSISNDWDTDQERSLSVAAYNVNLLRTDVGELLDCVRPLIQEQGRVTKDAHSRGQDIAQAYKHVEDKYNKAYFGCGTGYVVIALCNPDHFGNDAKKAYSSVHTLALRKAKEAHKSQKESDLTEAYFIEGFAQHYLTDMFAAGHIRTPRRLLHSTEFTLDLYPGDKCCKAQHDEDGANGLWVTNQEGTSWASYGDKQLGQGRSGKNLQMVVIASQAGVDEIWDTFQSGEIPDTVDFKALRKAPIPEKAFGISNSVPLFERSPKNPSHMLFRQNIDQRGIDSARVTIRDVPSNDEWARYLGAVQASGISKNMYVYSKSFSSDQSFLHIGRIDQDSSKVVSNLYGPVNAAKFGQYWGMSAQGIGTVKISDRRKLWTSADSLGTGVSSLVGRVFTGAGRSAALHVGYGYTEDSNGQMSVKILWDQTVDDGNSDRVPGATIYGTFAEGSSERAMLKFFDGGNMDSRLELWSLPSATDSPKLITTLETTKLNFLVSHKIDRSDSFSIVVGYQSGPFSASTGAWHFCSWTADYKQTRLFTISEQNSIPAQALLSDPLSNRIIRIYYGQRFQSVQTLQVDVIVPVRNETDGKITLNGPPTSQIFPIKWQALREEDYLLWFMHDVNGNGHADLVGYTSDASNVYLNVVVFPSRGDGTFDTPVLSPINLGSQIGNLLTAEFMRPLYTAQTTYSYTNTGSKSAGAIMSFFDNYGIIGTRIIAPEASRGTYKYELKGQDSAIAGQRSSTLGERPTNWMGLHKKVQGVGIVPVL